MAGGKETPRQKMIGMMYLVLTALLALNVSKEILDAFVVMNNGLINTDKNFTQNNMRLYNALQGALETEPERAKIPYQSSLKVKDLSKELYNFVSEIKSDLIQAEDKVSKQIADTMNLEFVGSKDKYDEATRIMCGLTVDGSGGKARILKNKINEFKNKLIALLPSSVQKTTNLGLDTNDPPKKGTEKETWETNKFYHLPLAAQIAVLSQIQTEIRNAEGTVLNELFKSIGSNTIKVDKLAAQMIPSANIVTIGDEFTAKVFVAAFNSKMTPDVTINGAKITETDETGSVIYKTRPGSEGPQRITAIARFMNAEGKPEESKVEYEYMAIKPVAVVSPTKMNVFYIGVDNPVSVSVPGSDPNKVVASFSGQGSISKVKSGEYMVRVTGGGNCSIPVSVGSSNMGAPQFRVKRIPDPVPTVMGKKSGESISAGELSAAGGIIAQLENFDFQASFQVTGFEFGVNVNGQYNSVQASGNRFPDAALTILRKAKPGSKVFISDIKARGPDGTTRTLNASYKLR